MASEFTKEFLAKYADKVGGTFFNDPIANMTREELLGLVDWMQDEMQRIENQRQRERDMQCALRKSFVNGSG